MTKKYKSEYLPSIWIVSFTDLLSVLLIFFLLILSSNLHFAQKNNTQPNHIDHQTNRNIIPNNIPANNIIDLDYLEILLKDQINDSAVNSYIQFLQKKHRLIIRINHLLLLEKNILSNEGKKLFEIIAFHLREINNRMEVKYKVVFATQAPPKFELLYPNFLSAEKLFYDIKELVDRKIHFGFEIRPKTNEDNVLEYLDIIIDDY
jgi:hypothetical protein